MANNKIQIKRSSVSGRVPTALQLDVGEFAVNLVDNRLFTKNASNTVIEVFGQSLNTSANVTFTNVNTASLTVGGTIIANTLSGNVDWSYVTSKPDLKIDITGDATGNNTFTDLANGSINIALANTTVTAGTYGNSSVIPVITVDSKGRITSATTNAVAGITGYSYTSANNTFAITAGDGSVYKATIGTVNTLSVSNTLTVTGVGTFSNDVNITGNLSVLGVVSFINTTQLNVGDNIITLNANTSGAPVLNAGIEVNRGTSSNVSVLWDEAIDKWTFTNDGAAFQYFVGNTDLDTAISGAATTATNLAGNAYSNAVSTAATDATNKAANAYSNAVSTAATDATDKAANAYSNAVSTAATDATNKAANAYSNAVSTAATDATDKAANAYSNAVSTAATDATNKAANAYSNAVSTAATDATNKAANAYSNAVSYADTAAATAYSNATSYADTAAATAYSNAVSTAATDASSKAATAYSNAVSTAATDASSKAATAYSNAVSTAAADATTKAATAYSNATSYADTAAATAYANAIYWANAYAVTAYSNATSYADTKAAAAYSNATSYADTAAATAYSNATSFATTIAGTAYSNAVSTAATDASSKAATAYSNAVSYADTKAGAAYSNAISYADTKADAAYSNATSFATTVATTAYNNAIAYSGNAAAAYANAIAYSGNAAAAYANAVAYTDTALSSKANTDSPSISNASFTVQSSFSGNVYFANVHLILNGDTGTAGQVLTSGGAGANAYWSTVTGGGSGATYVISTAANASSANVKILGSDDSNSTVKFIGAGGINVSSNGSVITVDGTSVLGNVSTNSFGTFAVSGQSSVVADQANDTLTFVAGTNMTITTNASGDTITFSSSGTGGGTTGNNAGNAFISGRDNFVGDGTTTAFTLSQTATANNILVLAEGLVQFHDEDYDVSGTTLTFTSAPADNEHIEVIFISGASTYHFMQYSAIDTFTGDGTTTVFELSRTANTSTATVHLDGLLQAPTTDFSFSNTSLTFTAAPLSGEVVLVYHNDTVSSAVPGTAIASTDVFVGDGTTTAFTLSGVADISTSMVTLNGILQGYTTEYTVSGTTLTFVEAPPSGSRIQAVRLAGSVGSAFASIVVGSNTVVADTTSSTLTLANTAGVTLQANGNTITIGSTDIGRQSLTGDGTTTAFTLTYSTTADDIFVYVNGIYFHPDEDYTVSDTTLTFTTAPVNTSQIRIRFMRAAVVTLSSLMDDLGSGTGSYDMGAIDGPAVDLNA